MRLNLRLRGTTSSGRPCLMDLTVYAASQKDFMEEVQKRSTEGPWYYADSAEAVPESEEISVEGVEHLDQGMN